MASGVRIGSLIPAGLTVTEVVSGAEVFMVTACSEARTAVCPSYGRTSRRVHSRYVRRVVDLPCSGRAVRIGIVTRRFWCDIPACPQRIFAERFETAVPALVAARDLIARFHIIIRRKTGRDLDPWIEEAKASPVASFAKGIVRDRAAVRAAIISPWSNGQTEGQITRLKLVKRQMYGRAKIDLLQVRLIGA